MDFKKITKKQQEELRQIWLSSVLNLQKGLPISNVYDGLFNHNKKDIMIITRQLGKSYQKNMNIFKKVLGIIV